jgi:hypothetical protein
MSDAEHAAGRTQRWLCVGLVAAWGGLLTAPGARAQPNQEGQEGNPFALKQSSARALPSILERDAQGKVVWLASDPSRKAIELMNVSAEERRTMQQLMAERDEQLLAAAVPHTDKIIEVLEFQRQNNAMAYDAFGRRLLAVLGEFGVRGAFNYDAQVRKAISRGAYTDLNAIVREYNLARVAEEHAVLQERAKTEPLSEILLRDSTTLQRFQQLDVAADAARLLRGRFGGEAALAKAHPELADAIENDGYWVAMSRLTDEQLAAFVSAQTGQVVDFPSPEAGEAQPPTTSAEPQAAGPALATGPSDEQLEAMRAPVSDGPTIVRRGPDGRAVRLDQPGYLAAFELMVDEGAITEAEAERLRTVIADRDAVFDQQSLRLYEYLLEAASHGPVEAAPLEQAVLHDEWRLASLMYGAWLNEQLPSPSTFHNDPRVREAIERDSLIELARIASEYDNAHIFDARIELLRMVRDGKTTADPDVAMPANIKRPWRLQQIIGDAKASYARQLRVTEPDFRGVLASLEVGPEVAESLRYVVAADGPLTEADFWVVAVKLPPAAHRQLIQRRTGYEAPEPGHFEGKTPVPATGGPGQ